jgi:carbamoyl-phosphate synthase large subunit
MHEAYDVDAFNAPRDSMGSSPLTSSSVLITGAGGAAVPALIERLQAAGRRVVAVDADPNAAGLYVANRAYRVPFAASPDYAGTMRGICRREGVEALIPLVDEELLPCAALGDELGIAVIGPRPEFIALCLDKYQLIRRMADTGLPVPATRLLADGPGDLEPPLVLKPRVGRGSRDVRIIRTRGELEAQLATGEGRPGKMLLQTYVEGTEFTVSVVVWRDGRVRAVIPKQIVDKRGITRIAITRRHAAIDALCREIQARLRADGPFNVQLRVDARSGLPLTFEINPRFSTTITLTQAAGVDELGAVLDLALGVEPQASWDWREGVTLIRRTLDSFVEERDYQAKLDEIGRVP